jgi:hypothetical protein
LTAVFKCWPDKGAVDNRFVRMDWSVTGVENEAVFITLEDD